MFLKLNFQDLSKSILSIYTRFPLEIICIYIITILGICLMNHNQFQNYEFMFIKIIITCILGSFLFATTSMISERYNLYLLDFLNKLIIIGILIGYYYYLPVNESEFDGGYGIFIFLINLLGILCTLMTGYIFNKYNTLNYWKFNYFIIKRFLFSAFYGIFLYLGLALLLFSLDYLFEIKIEGYYYGQLRLLIHGLFTSNFFLAGIPYIEDNLDEADFQSNYFKVFSKYILIFLVLIYQLVLYAYSLKILLTGILPKGGVVNLINGYSALSLLSFLALYYNYQKNNNKFISIYLTTIFLSIIIFSILYFQAINIRVRDYGITISRYYVIIYGIWLLIIAFYYLLSRQKNIFLMPVSGFLMIGITLIGPWNAFSYCEQNQIDQIEKFLINKNILQNGIITSNSISYEDFAKLNSILRYLAEFHKLDKLVKWLDADMTNEYQQIMKTTSFSNNYKYQIINIITKKLSTTNNSMNNINNINKYFNLNFQNITQDKINISGYQNLIYFTIYGDRDTSKEGAKLIDYNLNSNILIYHAISGDVNIPLNEYLQQNIAKSQNNLENRVDDSIFIYSGNNQNFKIHFQQINGHIDNNLIKIEEIQGELLIQ